MQRTAFEGGEPVGVAEPEIYFDEKPCDPHADADMAVRETLKLLLSCPNPVLQARILATMLGVGYAGCSEQSIAKDFGVTRAAVSNRMVKLREEIGLSRPVGPMRQDSTRKRCVDSRVGAVCDAEKYRDIEAWEERRKKLSEAQLRRQMR